MYVGLTLEKLLAANAWTLQAEQPPPEAQCLALTIMLTITFMIFCILSRIAAWVTGLNIFALAQDRRSRALLLVFTIAITPFVMQLIDSELPLSPTLWLFGFLQGVVVFFILERLLPPLSGSR